MTAISFVSPHKDWDQFINRSSVPAVKRRNNQAGPASAASDWLQSQQILAPIGSQEIWAAA